VLAQTYDPPLAPFIAVMVLGFLVGIAGHIWGSKTAVAMGIGMVFLATLILPLIVYLQDN
jgi:hypothetical protein